MKTWVSHFWSHIDMSGGPDACWPWVGNHDGKGYGLFRISGRKYLTHRLAFEFRYGPIAPGCIVRHFECDNPPCCNPRHLAPGSHRDNAQDRMRAGHTATGERHGAHKLTWAAVREIRTATALGNVTQRQLGAQYGVTHSVIGQILRGEIWREDSNYAIATRENAPNGHCRAALCK